MRSHKELRRIGVWLTTTSLCLSTLPPAVAQPTPQINGDQAGNQGTDPPTLAGRLAALTGAVSFHAAGETQWNAATLNYPVTTGEAFWTEPQASATLEIADNRLVMDDSTEIDVTALDQNQLAATEAQGAIFLQLNSLAPGQGVSVNTPRGTVQINTSGRYEIVAGDTNDATAVTVVEGAAHVTGSNLSLDVGPQQTATIGGTDVLQGNVGPMQPDTFLQAQISVRPRRTASVAPRQVRYMTGAADLQDYGSYTQNAQYGQVWYPNDVASNWAPYRDGHWAYVQPWGWTWVDSARWGFAPFHYGRWVQVENRWGWVAGDGEAETASAYPVYSPALVSFVDVGGAALAGAALGFAAGELAGGYAPAWIPLGPREPYYPWYHCRADYFGRINAPYGVPRALIERGPTYNTVTNIRTVNNFYINRRAATVVPANIFVRGQGLRDIGRPLPERFLSQARPIVGRLPVRPTAFTPNLSPAVARRFNVALPRTPVQPVAAGPRVLPVQPGRIAPELRRASLPGNIHPTPAAQVQGRPAGIAPGAVRQPGQASSMARPELGAPQAGSPGQPARPGLGLPALRTPGARPDSVPQGGANRPRPGGAVPGRATGAITPTLGAGRPGAVIGESPRLPAPISGAGAVPQAGQPRAVALPRAQALVHVPAPRPAPPVQVPRPAPRVSAPRLEAPRPAPQVTTARPAPRSEAPRPVPRPETQRPAPRVEPPRPAPRLETPRPPLKSEAPRQVAPPSRPAAPPAPRPVTTPAARPAPGPAKREPPH